MKFVLVNDGPPHGLSICARCSKAIQSSYLRDLASKLSYCDYRCYPARETIPVAPVALVRVPICTEQSAP
jgi:hypothetical protein